MHYIDNTFLSINELYQLVHLEKSLSLSEDAINKIQDCRLYLDKKILSQEAVYGVNTGFGSLCNQVISDNDIEQLQMNLLLSHACGFGDEVPSAIVKLMLLLKIQSLSYGYSGVQLQTVQRLIDFYNHNILPVVYEQGSLGASGDLAPLAHMSLPLIGLGEVYYKGQKRPSSDVLQEVGLEPITLKSKEGLALINGTQFMSAYALHVLFKSLKISYLADVISAISLDAFYCRKEPFDKLIHQIRPHHGQIKTAQNILEILSESELMSQTKKSVQDPYSFRCIPQVHGATKDTIDFFKNTVTTEVNSVTDNPNIFVKEQKIISAGNFHGQPLALGMDFMAISLSELASISERRTYLLISGQRGLPTYLMPSAGLHSGFMIPQYTAASIVSQNKQLCTPSSIDSITSSNGQEDHVSMGANAATKLLRVIENTERVLSIELMTASQAMSFRDIKSSEFIVSFLANLRKEVPVIDHDQIMHVHMKNSLLFVQSISLDEEILF